MKNNMQEVAAKGRGGDTQIAHVMKGETLIPPGVLTPELLQQIYAEMESAGIDPREHTVGEGMSINPETGLPEFGFGKFFKKAAKIALPVAAYAIGGPVLGGAVAGGLNGGLKGAVAGGLTGYAGIGGGSALGNALGFSGATATGIGSGLIGAGAGGLTGGLKGALLGGALGGGAGYANAGGFDSLYQGSTLQDLYTGASGALDGVNSGISDLYNGSTLQDAFKSGGDALKSVGIDTSSLASSPAPALGGGSSQYGSNPNYLDTSATDSALNSTALDGAATTGATQVAGSNNYISPLVSALLGSRANDQAEKALLAGQRANQQLLAPYANGFNFSPGDLTQDPGYQFNLQQGTQAADRAQLARGGYFSGEAAKELAQFNQGLADNTYNTAFNRALQGNQAGLTGALANAGINTDIGNIKANSSTNSSNLLSGALGSILPGSSFTNTGALRGGFDIQDFLRRNGIGNSAYAS